MNSKRIIFMFTGVLIIGFIVLVAIICQVPDSRFDMMQANDIVKTLAANWDHIEKGGEPDITSALQYSVFDEDAKAIYFTRSGLCQNLNDAIRDRYIIMDVIKEGQMVGKVGFYNDVQEVLERQRVQLIVGVGVLFVFLAGLCAVYTYYLYCVVIAPFNRMQGFARRVASGDLEVPLEMDKRHLFGAFTESFDIMREELHRARESEREANKSKKELVASLSHDIKTPVATIKAVTEVMAALAEDDKEKERLQIIEAKAEQVNSLVTNMFHATLEELQELNVSPAEMSSTAISELVQGADYEGRVQPFCLQDCIVMADSLRLSQVFDNIICNSYKYAGTPIEIGSVFEEDYLMIEIRDFGLGVSNEELSMITGKFCRGKNAEDKSGYGLGLFISTYLMNQMLGDIICENLTDGFCVKILLRLAS